MNNPYLAQIKAHEQEIRNNPFPKGLEICPNCQRSPGKFRIHSYRERIFQILIDSCVQQIKSFLARLLCDGCKGIFTYYPEYALPYKRYLRPQIEQKSQEYLEEKGKTYEQVASDAASAAILYEKQESSKLIQRFQEKEFAKSTVWRWISFFGKQEDYLQKAFSLIGQKDPQTNFFRKVYEIVIYPGKYKTDTRKDLLITASKVLGAMRQLVRVLGKVEKFTELATGF